MQFYKKTSIVKTNLFGIILRLVIILSILVFGVFLLSKINFPAPNKKIENIIPNEKLKVIK
tara:strand:- start:745 stop:927 length:183 start_codon:yes stop_codon:yes gene_type:complete